MTSTKPSNPGKLFTTADIGKQFSWDDVSQIHKTRNGIYQRNGTLISLLTDFGRINPMYPDFHGETQDTIHYTGSGRRGDQKLDLANKAMIEAIHSELGVPLFNKLGVNQWAFMGYWRVVEANYIYDQLSERMVWKFRLERISSLHPHFFPSSTAL